MTMAPENTVMPSVAALATDAAELVAAPVVPVPIKIVFFCKDCEKIVVGTKIGNKYVYKCPVCHTKNVAFGTEKSIKSFYRVKE